MARLWAVLLASGLVAGCSGAGPFGGMLGGPQHEEVVIVEPVETYAGLVVAPDGSVLLPGVRSISADRSHQGVILRAEAIAPTQGFWGGTLVSSAAPAGNGIEAVQFRAFPPVEPQPVGAPATRILQIGRFYSNDEMEGIRSFRVIAGQNALTAAAPPPLPEPPPPPPPEF